MSASLQSPDNGTAQLVELELIDEPARAMRETMDDVALAELAQSIAEVGLIQPLVLERAGARFRVIAGHRRLIACQICKLVRVPSIIREQGAIDPSAVTLAENYYREPVNPVEEAAFLQTLLDEKCNGDIEVLAALIRHKVSYVDDRLLLLRGDAAVLDALRQQKISLAVARELNRVKEPGQRSVFLDAAIRGGATAAVVRTWRTDGEVSEPATLANSAESTLQTVPSAASAETSLRCMFCADTDNPHMMELLWLHSYCKKVVMQILGRVPEEPAKGT